MQRMISLADRGAWLHLDQSYHVPAHSWEYDKRRGSHGRDGIYFPACLAPAEAGRRGASFD